MRRVSSLGTIKKNYLYRVQQFEGKIRLLYRGEVIMTRLPWVFLDYSNPRVGEKLSNHVVNQDNYTQTIEG